MSTKTGYEAVIENKVKEAVGAIPGLEVKNWSVATRSLNRTSIAYGKITLNREITATEKLAIMDALNAFSASALESQRRGTTVFFWDDKAYRPAFFTQPGGSTRVTYYEK